MQRQTGDAGGFGAGFISHGFSAQADGWAHWAFQSIVGGYQSYFIEGKVIEAYEKSREATKKSLEQVVDEEGNVIKLKPRNDRERDYDREYAKAA